jgi:hypothetical protein
LTDGTGPASAPLWTIPTSSAESISAAKMRVLQNVR